MDCKFSGGGGAFVSADYIFNASRWRQVTDFLWVSPWIIRLSSLLKNATSFLNEIAKSLYEWVIESLTQPIYFLKMAIYSWTKQL